MNGDAWRRRRSVWLRRAARTRLRSESGLPILAKCPSKWTVSSISARVASGIMSRIRSTGVSNHAPQGVGPHPRRGRSSSASAVPAPHVRLWRSRHRESSVTLQRPDGRTQSPSLLDGPIRAVTGAHPSGGLVPWGTLDRGRSDVRTWRLTTAGGRRTRRAVRSLPAVGTVVPQPIHRDDRDGAEGVEQAMWQAGSSQALASALITKRILDHHQSCEPRVTARDELPRRAKLRVVPLVQGARKLRRSFPHIGGDPLGRLRRARPRARPPR